MGTSFDNFFNEKEAEVKVPDLDWAVIDVDKKDNIPRPFNVQIIPELQAAWNYKDKSASLIPNTVNVERVSTNDKISSSDIKDIVNTAKKEIMAGLIGKDLASKLSSLYPNNLIKEASEELRKVSEEQGLLGNVYVDLSPFDTCKEAAKKLGSKVRLAKYVIGDPKKCVCATHKDGFCSELKKSVVSSLDYNENVLKEYSTHLKIAGLIESNTVLSSKEDLRNALLPKSNIQEVKVASKESNDINYDEIKTAFEKELSNKIAMDEKAALCQRFNDVRPILAFIQNEMLKGKMGDSLKESIKSNFTSDIISKYSSEIKKIASLQGLIGNVYVDISYYKTPDEAIKAIKTASTNPTYIVQTISNGEYDDSINKVAKATGCAELPRDGKIDKKIASSYIDDLYFTDRISSDNANAFKKSLESNENVLGIIRDTFLATLSHKKEVREGGVKGYFHQSENRKYANRNSLKESTYKALEAGISVDKVETKLASMIPMPEAVGMVREALSHLDVVDANALNNCTTEKYHLNSKAMLKKASKCDTCILKTCNTCIVSGLRFASDNDEACDIVKLDPATKKVTLKNNPDEAREDMGGDYDLTTASWGSGSNIVMDKMRKEAC